MDQRHGRWLWWLPSTWLLAAISGSGCVLAACGGGSDRPATAGSGGDAARAGSPGAAGDGGASAAAGSGGRRDAGGRGGNAGSAAGAAASGGGGGGALAGSVATVSFDDARPAAGYADGHCSVPAEAGLEDVSKPDTVVGTGTPDSCTADAFVAAVAKGGVITFACGDKPVTITLTQTAKVFNDKFSDKKPKLVIDGGGKVALSGGDKVRILYQDTCDPMQVYTDEHCDNQTTPQLTIQNLTFEHGNSKGMKFDGGGGGAIFARGGRLKIVNSRFFNNVCEDTGPDIGGAAVRALSQSQNKPVYVVNSTFGGTQDLGNTCSNGGGLSSIDVSYTVINSLFSYNQAIGHGANPADPNTPGGGSGGAIYNDGDTFTLNVCGTLMEHNQANEGGGAIFFVSNDSSGSLVIDTSILRANPNLKFETDGFPGIFVQDTDDKPSVTNSMIVK